VSYILEALKKSDQQRQRGATPTLATAQPSAPPPRQSRLVFNSVLAVVLIAAGVAIGWWRPWQTHPVSEPARVTEAATSPQATTIPALPAAMPEAPTQTAPQMPQQASPVTVTPGMPTTQERSASLDQAPAMNVPPPVAAPPAIAEAPKQPAMPVPEPPSVQSPPPANTAGASAIVEQDQLPSSIQRQIPDMNIAFLAYSANPKDSRAMINGEMMQPGDSIRPGLTLDKINPDGIVLSYKGYRFRRGVR
jgi:general secretion pathway protein B